MNSSSWKKLCWPVFDGAPVLDWTVEVALPNVAGMEVFGALGAMPVVAFVEGGWSDKVGALDVVVEPATPGNEVGVPNEKFMMFSK